MSRCVGMQEMKRRVEEYLEIKWQVQVQKQGKNRVK